MVYSVEMSCQFVASLKMGTFSPQCLTQLFLYLAAIFCLFFVLGSWIHQPLSMFLSVRHGTKQM